MNTHHIADGGTVPGIGPGNWDSAILAREQERKALNTAIVYRLYTEDSRNLAELISRYFAGATIVYGTGLWVGVVETGAVIEIVATKGDLQDIVSLAGDIKMVNHQSSVLVTWQSISRLDV